MDTQAGTFGDSQRHDPEQPESALTSARCRARELSESGATGSRRARENRGRIRDLVRQRTSSPRCGMRPACNLGRRLIRERRGPRHLGSCERWGPRAWRLDRPVHGDIERTRSRGGHELTLRQERRASRSDAVVAKFASTEEIHRRRAGWHGSRPVTCAVEQIH